MQSWRRNGDVYMNNATLPIIRAMHTTADTILNDRTSDLYVFKLYRALSAKEILPHQEFLCIYVEVVRIKR